MLTGLGGSERFREGLESQIPLGLHQTFLNRCCACRLGSVAPRHYLHLVSQEEQKPEALTMGRRWLCGLCGYINCNQMSFEIDSDHKAQ